MGVVSMEKKKGKNKKEKGKNERVATDHVFCIFLVVGRQKAGN